MKKKTKKTIRRIAKTTLNIILVSMIIYNLKPVASKAIKTYENKQTYKQALEEKKELKETRETDWIRIPDTNIDYPVMWKNKDNAYYLSHDIYGNESSHGCIFYDGSFVPYEHHTTIMYGHCMRDGSMFNNLHKFKKSEEEFLRSALIIERKDGSTHKYKPLGLYVTNDDFFYNKLPLMTIDECINTIKENSRYDIDIEYNENSEVIVMMTCSYDNPGDRLFVFYISE